MSARDGELGRDELQPRHFAAWVDWARETGHGLDFNPTLFSHPLAEDGFTLSSYDEGVRQFWIDHCIACRRIGTFFGRELDTPCVTNIWIPDGYKDTPVDRKTPRLLLKDYLDRVHIGLDYFDASINRVAAWVIGTRNVLKALLMALLEPIERLRELEIVGDFTGRLALLEELKSLPFGAVWDHYCLKEGAPVGIGLVDEIRAYEESVLSQRE